MTLVATIESNSAAWISVTFTYNEDVKDELKELVGHGNYRWLPLTKRWSFRKSFHAQVVDCLEENDYEIDDRVKYVTSIAPIRAGNPWSPIFESLDCGLRRKLFRAATRVLHPDAGGTTEAMQILNAAWADQEDRG